MSNAIFKVPVPQNEPVTDYAPGTAERDRLQSALAGLAGQQIEIPLVIGGERVLTGNTGQAVQHWVFFAGWLPESRPFGIDEGPPYHHRSGG